ncbi:MAG: diguanylate cyclase, partial [Chloroflexota bacterium]
WETILAGKEWKGEFVNKKKNGELYYESASISPILDEQNNISHFVAIKEDITGRKRIEEKLKKNQASLTALIENTKDDIWSVDSSYCITTLNSNFHRNFLTAFNVSLQIGDNLIEVIEGISPDLKTQWQARYDRALQGEQFVEIDHFNIEGVPNYIEAAFNPIYLNEEIVEVSVFSHDITKRKTAEEALRKANQDLQVHVQQVESLQEKLREQAIRDSLTGLFNFHYIEEVLEREIIRFQRRKKSIGLILLDIDKFKEVNDTYGHNAGNLMLKKLAKVIKENIRGDDIPCRFGGDEFLIVMPETTTQVVFDRAELICKKFAALKIPYKDQEMSATFSAGVIAISPKEYTRDQLLNFVDQALYQAKNEGRNRVITYRGEL